MKFKSIPLDTAFYQTKEKINSWIHFAFRQAKDVDTASPGAFRTLVEKEVADHIKSWRFLILVAVLLLVGAGAIITAFSTIKENLNSASTDDPFFFLRLFTAGESGLPSFHLLINLLGPLLGISLAFDAINAEQIKGTANRILAQPIPRDFWINAKFTAALLVIGCLFLGIALIVTGAGMILLGTPPTVSEFGRILGFVLLSTVYVGFWLNLSLLFSVLFRQPATSALSALAVWIFLTVFYGILVNMMAKITASANNPWQVSPIQSWVSQLLKILPSQLYSDATSTMLIPEIRSLGPISTAQTYGAIPSPLPLDQSLMLVWPQITGLVAASMVCFGLAYYVFMRREIRSR